MVTESDILEVLRTIDDPEMPINIVDLGLVSRTEFIPFCDSREPGGGVHVRIDILPTFVGCHALPVIEKEIQRCVGALPGVATVEVRPVYSPAWSVDRVTPAGREALRRYGVTVPAAGGGAATPVCPFCGSSVVREESAFGPTRCRTIWYCDACRHPFEHLKRVSSTGLAELSLGRLQRLPNR